MTATLVSSPTELQLTASPFLSHYFLNQQFLNNKSSRANPTKKEDSQSSAAAALTSIWGALLEALPQGVMVFSRDLKLVYLNQKASRVCQLLAAGDRQPIHPPLVISEICHRLLKSNAVESQLMLMECQTVHEQTIRVRANWLALNPGGMATVQESPYILVLLENCNETLQGELRIEQQKYDLTEREAEIWMLLRQEYSYQDIAERLQISLNTVKTHVKNVYAKRRSSQGREQVVLF